MIVTLENGSEIQLSVNGIHTNINTNIHTNTNIDTNTNTTNR